MIRRRWRRPGGLLDDGAQQGGYYHVRTRDGLVGWMFRTLARRFPGEAPFPTQAILAWFDPDGNFQARGFVLRQSDRVNDPRRYLTSIDAIEEATGLDFFPDLADSIEEAVEAVVPDRVF